MAKAESHHRLARWMSCKLFDGQDIALPDIAEPAVGAASQIYVVSPQLTQSPHQSLDRLVVRQAGKGIPYYPDSDVGREYEVLRAVWQGGQVPVPEPIAYEADAAVLGSPFLVMRFVAGRVPQHNTTLAEAATRPTYNASGWLFDSTPQERRAVWRNGLVQLSRIARTDPAKLTALRRATSAEQPGLLQELDYWLAYRRWAAPTMPNLIEKAAAWLFANRPAPAAPMLAWGDARIGNMIFDGTECAAVIDWENASLGGPEMDLAWWLIMDDWHSAAMGVPRLEGLGTRADTLAEWASLTGGPPRDFAFHEVFAAYRLCAIVERKLASRGGGTNPLLPFLEQRLAWADAAKSENL